MKGIQALLGAMALAPAVQAALDPIVIKGQKFFHESTGEQFFMKGVAYQQDFAYADPSVQDRKLKYVDPLANTRACKIDIPMMKDMGLNTIRVYAIDPKKDQSECMKLLDEAGIYVVADLSEPEVSINRDAPEWDDRHFQRYKDVVDALQKYDNVLGFFAGNEVTNNATNTGASAFVKAAVRDTKAYIKEKGYRPIPVGYATNDDEEVRDALMEYFNCGPQEEAVDFWGYNIYSWCGESTLKTSGFDLRTKEYEDYSVPVFFAEYGCNLVRPRPFTEIKALYGPEMNKVWSGGIVYMWHEEPNEYGLVKVDGFEVEKLDDFDNLKSQLKKVDGPEGVKMSEYNPTNLKPKECPAVTDTWEVHSPELPPTPDSSICECMEKSLSCKASRRLREDDIGALFGYICGDSETDCSGIVKDPLEGRYGAFSMCTPKQQLSWAMNAYYLEQGETEDACDFDGLAELQDPSGDCQETLDAVGGLEGAPTGGSKSGSSNKGDKEGAAGLNSVAMSLISAASVFSMGYMMM